MSGRAKAAVLPVPVWAQPNRSRPARTWGMALVWIGVGVALLGQGPEHQRVQAEIGEAGDRRGGEGRGIVHGVGLSVRRCGAWAGDGGKHPGNRGRGSCGNRYAVPPQGCGGNSFTADPGDGSLPAGRECHRKRPEIGSSGRQPRREMAIAAAVAPEGSGGRLHQFRTPTILPCGRRRGKTRIRATVAIRSLGRLTASTSTGGKAPDPDRIRRRRCGPR